MASLVLLWGESKKRKKLGHIDYIHNSVHGKTGGKRIIDNECRNIYREIIMLTTTYQMRLCGLQGSSRL